VAYVYDPRERFPVLCNASMVDLERVTAVSGEEGERPSQKAPSVDNAGMGDMLSHDVESLRILIERHLLHTGSKRAKHILDNWDAELARFWKVMPKDYRRALTDMAEARRAASAVAAE